MKKLMMLLMVAALTVPAAGCGTNQPADGSLEDNLEHSGEVADPAAAGTSASNDSIEDNLEHSGEIAQLPNPWTEYDSLKKACEDSGFEMTAPDSMDGYEVKTITAIKGEIIQVDFSHNEEDKADYETSPYVTFRKGIGSEDISGDYNYYSVTTEKEIAGNTVTLKGDDATISNATWSDGTYSYAIMSNPGMDADTMTALVEGLK